ncbi:hypothetical protein B0I35DRAFT_414782 [Stachybotrys elegans]|uniref:Uncharacterized protein n=1 Tax=Stachybotrys elegans TaxID=80388 RepID=A0A8K0SI06_9HYPO|nr:hypothetical protein B0I35DRAFT_414782 [Stachybotrys elegans]
MKASLATCAATLVIPFVLAAPTNGGDAPAVEARAPVVSEERSEPTFVVRDAGTKGYDGYDGECSDEEKNPKGYGKGSGRGGLYCTRGGRGGRGGGRGGSRR